MRERRVIRELEANGWEAVRQTGSHVQLRNPGEPWRGTVMVTDTHSELPRRYVRKLEKRTGVSLLGR